MRVSELTSVLISRSIDWVEASAVVEVGGNNEEAVSAYVEEEGWSSKSPQLSIRRFSSARRLSGVSLDKVTTPEKKHEKALENMHKKLPA